MCIRTTVVFVAVLLAIAICAPASAQHEDPSTLYERVTTYDMAAGEVIEAAVEVPRMSRIDEQRRRSHASLIRLREDYRKEVLSSVHKL